MACEGGNMRTWLITGFYSASKAALELVSDAGMSLRADLQK